MIGGEVGDKMIFMLIVNSGGSDTKLLLVVSLSLSMFSIHTHTPQKKAKKHHLYYKKKPEQ